jgi:hypothetical protein
MSMILSSIDPTSYDRHSCSSRAQSCRRCWRS